MPWWMKGCVVVMPYIAVMGCMASQDNSSVEWYAGMHEFGAPQHDHNQWEHWLLQEWRDSSGRRIAFEVTDFREPVVKSAIVNTCEKLFDADKNGLDSSHPKREAYVLRRLHCYAGRSIKEAIEAEHSNFNKFEMNVVDFQSLPAEIAPPMSPMNMEGLREIIARRGGMNDAINYIAPTAKYDKSEVKRMNRLTLTDNEGWIYEWTLLAKGDFDHNGVEDLLISGLLRKDPATRPMNRSSILGMGLFVVTRHESGAPLSLVQEISVLTGSVQCHELIGRDRCGREVTPRVQRE